MDAVLALACGGEILIAPMTLWAIYQGFSGYGWRYLGMIQAGIHAVLLPGYVLAAIAGHP